MLPNEKAINKNNVDLYLRELSKEFRKLNGRTIPAEIILIGGVSVLINYGFRNTTYVLTTVISLYFANSIHSRS